MLTENEIAAIAVGESPELLRLELYQAYSTTLTYYLRSCFLCTTDFLDLDRRRLVSTCGTLALEWRVRRFPDQPISCDNQQTPKGIICLVVLNSTPE